MFSAGSSASLTRGIVSLSLTSVTPQGPRWSVCVSTKLTAFCTGVRDGPPACTLNLTTVSARELYLKVGKWFSGSTLT